MTPNTPEQIGDMIRTERRKKGMTQRALGQLLGVSDSFVAHLEGGLRLPSASVTMALSKAFGFSARRRERFLRDVETARIARNADRIRARGAAVRGAVGQRTENKRSANGLNADHIARDFERDAALAAAYQDLRKAYRDPKLRDTVVNTLRALAANARKR
jgi:transcriptional regulator with XRE-family HTH domain